MQTAKLLIFFGIVLILSGVGWMYFGNFLNWFGKLPGDFHYKSENTSVFFPFTSMLIISLLTSILLYFCHKMMQ